MITMTLVAEDTPRGRLMLSWGVVPVAFHIEVVSTMVHAALVGTCPMKFIELTDEQVVIECERLYDYPIIEEEEAGRQASTFRYMYRNFAREDGEFGRLMTMLWAYVVAYPQLCSDAVVAYVASKQ